MKHMEPNTCKLAVWEPGNGTRYTVLLMRLAPSEAKAIGFSEQDEAYTFGITPGDGAMIVGHFAAVPRVLDRVSFWQRMIARGTNTDVWRHDTYEVGFAHRVFCYLFNIEPWQLSDHRMPDTLPDAISELKEFFGLYTADDVLAKNPTYKYRHVTNWDKYDPSWL